MALTQQTVVDKIEVLEDGVIQVRRDRRVFDDAELIGHKYLRYTLEPGQDVTGQPPRVQVICNAVWTPAVVAAYLAAQAARTAQAANP